MSTPTSSSTASTSSFLLDVERPHALYLELWHPLLLEIAFSGQPAAVSKNREPEAEGWRLFKRGHHSGAREGSV
jgi:hypothetical protein